MIQENITEILTAILNYQKQYRKKQRANMYTRSRNATDMIFCVFYLTIKNQPQSASHPNAINNPYSRKSFAVTLSIE